MRILLVSHGFPPYGVAGVERQAMLSADGLTRLGHEVTVLTRRPTAAPALPRREDVELDGVQTVLVVGGALAAHGASQRAMERIFLRCLIEHDYDAVLAVHLKGHSPDYVRIAQDQGIPVVVELHDYYFACERAHLEREDGDLCAGPEGGRACWEHCRSDRSQPGWAQRVASYRDALRRADAVLCPSRQVASYFSALFGPGVEPEVLGSGIVPQQALGIWRPPLPGSLRLASVGAVIRHKGAHAVVRALALARLESADYTLFGVVDPAYLSEVRDQAKAVANLRLRAYGPYELAELPYLLATVDAVVVPSLVAESYSLVAREAVSLGVPVLGAREGALAEFVRDGENGYLFDPRRPASLALILRDLAKDPAELERLREGFREDEWLSTHDRTARVEQVLAAAISRGPAPATSSDEAYELASIREACEAPRPPRPTHAGLGAASP